MTGLCTLTVMSWGGPMPLPGEYVKSQKGRTAFLIVSVDLAKPGLGYVAKFRCERKPAISLTPSDVAHPWKWSKR